MSPAEVLAIEMEPNGAREDTTKSNIAKAGVLREQAQVMRARYPELSNIIYEMVDLYVDYHMAKRQQIARVFLLLGKYESFPAMVGEAFIRIVQESIEQDARERGYSLEVTESLVRMPTS